MNGEVWNRRGRKRKRNGEKGKGMKQSGGEAEEEEEAEEKGLRGGVGGRGTSRVRGPRAGREP